MRRREELKKKVATLLDSQRHVRQTTKFCELLGVSRRSLHRWRTGTTLPPVKFLKKLCELVDIDYLTFTTIHEGDKAFLSSLTLDVLVQNYKNIKNYEDLGDIVGFCGVVVAKYLKKANLETKAVTHTYTASSDDPAVTVELYFKNPNFYDLCVYIFGGPGNIHVKCRRTDGHEEHDLYFGELSEYNIKKLIDLILTEL